MKTVKTFAVVVFTLISFSTFANLKTDKEPVIVKAWGLVFGSLESLSKRNETPFALAALPEFNFGTADDINLKDADALKSVGAAVLPKFHFNSPQDINVNEIEALKEVDQQFSLPLFYTGTPQDLNVQEIEALKGIASN